MSRIKKIEKRRNKVLLINKKYIIKNASKECLIAEKLFINKYTGKIQVEEIVKENVKNNFIIYKYINGHTINTINDVNNCLNSVYQITQSYITVKSEGYGYLNDLKDSWGEFLRSQVKEKNKYIRKNNLTKEKKVLKEIESIEKIQERKLIHGDLGTFNIICKNKRIVGIIDPKPIIGDPLYDYIYFIFSNYNIIKEIKIEDIFKMLKDIEKERILALMYILLYDRISIEEKYNTKYVEQFYQLWRKIEKFEKNNKE